MRQAIATRHPVVGKASTSSRDARLRALGLLMLLVAVALFVVVVLWTNGAELLKGVDLGNDQGTADGKEGIEGISGAIEALQEPANVTVVSLGGLGAAAGAAMMAVGSPKGMKVLGSSAGALAALGLGNGLIA
jgi:hypothetical protein